MRLRYTARAARQIAEILDYLEERSRQGATTIGRRFHEAATLLENHPEAGRRTDRRSVVRRISVAPHPYIIDYRIDRTEIVILSVRHTSRRPLKPN